MKILMKNKLDLNPHCLFKLEAMGKIEAGKPRIEVAVVKIGAKESNSGDNLDREEEEQEFINQI